MGSTREQNARSRAFFVSIDLSLAVPVETRTDPRVSYESILDVRDDNATI
jgi:hypothetical protein